MRLLWVAAREAHVNSLKKISIEAVCVERHSALAFYLVSVTFMSPQMSTKRKQRIMLAS